jgi:tetratricopeptide (TPR) repeat protein
MTVRRSKKKMAPARNGGLRAKQMVTEPSVPTHWPAIIVILVLTFLAYCRALRFQFVFDDRELVIKNPHIQSWSYLADYFTKGMWSQETWHQRYYRPFLLLWLRINHAFFGLDPFYWHLTTIASYLLATLLLYILVLKLLRYWVPAAFAALFFGLHPIHVEVAAWNSAASESLLTAALIASLLCYINGARRNSNWWFAGSLIYYASALLLKETAMVFPVIVFTYAWLWFDGKKHAGRFRFALIRTLPFLALTMIYLTVRWIVLQNLADVQPFGIKTLVLTMPSVIYLYCKLLIWPVVSSFYNTPQVHEPGWSNFILPLLAITAVSCFLAVIIWKAWKTANEVESAKGECRLTILACVWMVAFLLPVLYLPSLHDGAFVQGRYLYLPSAGFLILLSVGLTSFGRASRRVLGVPWAQALPALVLASMMAIGTEAQCGIWANNLTLFTRAVEQCPENTLARDFLGAALVGARRYDDAIQQFRVVLRQDPDDSMNNNDLTMAYYFKGDWEHAEEFLTTASQRSPTADQLYLLGKIRFNLGRMDAAEHALRQSIAMDENRPSSHYVLGMTLERQGKLNPAIEAFQQELAAHPDNVEAQQELSHLSDFMQKQSVVSRP